MSLAEQTTENNRFRAVLKDIRAGLYMGGAIALADMIDNGGHPATEKVLFFTGVGALVAASLMPGSEPLDQE